MWLKKSRGHKNGESTKALKDAEVHLKEVQLRGPEVTEVSSKLRMIRERNHFAEQLHIIISGGNMEGGNHAARP